MRLPFKPAMLTRGALDSLASVFFPAPCRICSAVLATASRIPICGACLASITPIQPPMCGCCGRPYVSPVLAGTPAPPCRLCRARLYGFDQARSFAPYDGSLAAAILLLKYERVLKLGDWFAARLEEALAAFAPDWRFDAVVAVPLHRARERERGYNQSELIARPLAHRTRRELLGGVLVRTKPRPPRLILSRSEHWKSIRGAYEMRPGRKVDNLRILLVDDVLTTGATLDACARALKGGGAAAVFGLTVGRSVPAWMRPKQPNRGPEVVKVQDSANRQLGGSI